MGNILTRGSVFSVPMRNWNPTLYPLSGMLHSFLAYLWGIETDFPDNPLVQRREFLAYLWGIETSAPARAGSSRGWVFSVPMRNWNRECRWWRYENGTVFSVPMRNWNWKIKKRNSKSYSVFSVPMRNWNSTSWTKFDPLAKVFSVPMRNWNLNWQKCMGYQPTTFLAYLWGIETPGNQPQCCHHHQFLAYLWGIETYLSNHQQSAEPKFLAYLWGIETRWGSNLNFKLWSVFSVPMRNWNMK